MSLHIYKSIAEVQAECGKQPCTERNARRYDSVAPEVEKIISELGAERVDKVLYAETKFEAWIAYCVIAQIKEIPVPTS